LMAAAAAVVAIAAGTLAMTVSHDSAQPGSPGSLTSVGHHSPQTRPFEPTTSGGRVLIGE
jgi:hypothetical protein